MRKIGFLVLVAWIGLQLTPGVAQVAQTYSKDRGYFYRFRAAFEVKDTGERLDFDYIVACNIRLTRWRDGGLSNDGTYSPRAMFKATARGQVVMLRTLNACHGLTSENGDVPPDALPLAIWFDDASKLSTGLGYVSEDAYENPLGKLKFHGARVDRATQADWEVWRKKSADEYVQLGALPGPWGYDFPTLHGEDNPDRGKYISGCEGYTRLKLPESMRDNLRKLWPADRPRFWTLPNKEERFKIGEVISDPKQPFPPGIGRWVSRFGSPGGTGSLPIRSGREVSSSPHVRNSWPAEYYPFLWPPLISILPVVRAALNPSPDTYAQKLEFRDGALKGFAACQNIQDIYYGRVKTDDPMWLTKRHVFKVDDTVAKELSQRWPISERPSYVAERDDAVFVHFNVGF